MKNGLLALTASLALVGSMSASVNNSTSKRMSNNLEFSHTPSSLSVIAREKEPGDDRGKHKRGLDDPKGHKLAPQVAREKEPGDDRGKHKRGLDDPKGHKFAPEVAREKEPGDDRGHDGRDHHHRGRRNGRGDDGKGHQFA